MRAFNLDIMANAAAAAGHCESAERYARLGHVQPSPKRSCDYHSRRVIQGSTLSAVSVCTFGQ
jgi:hypothetical protein